jgi:hypothetical protein
LPYLNCPNCRLTVYSGAALASWDECPRCAARLGKVSKLFRSDLPHRLMEKLERSMRPGAEDAAGPR